MITVIQRVSWAKVEVDNQVIGKISAGMMALVAVEKNDSSKSAGRLLERMLNYRIFPDGENRMNLSLKDIHGGLLLIPQFTLAADTNTGNRPSFTPAAAPEEGKEIFAFLQKQAKETYDKAEFGQFGADMKVSLLNDGPVTFILKAL